MKIRHDPMRAMRRQLQTAQAMLPLWSFGLRLLLASRMPLRARPQAGELLSLQPDERARTGMVRGQGCSKEQSISWPVTVPVFLKCQLIDTLSGDCGFLTRVWIGLLRSH